MSQELEQATLRVLHCPTCDRAYGAQWSDRCKVCGRRNGDHEVRNHECVVCRKLITRATPEAMMLMERAHPA